MKLFVFSGKQSLNEHKFIEEIDTDEEKENFEFVPI